MERKKLKILYNIYYNEGNGNADAAFSSPSKIFHAVRKYHPDSNISPSDIKEFLSQTYSYNLYREKPKTSKYKKSKTFRPFMTYKKHHQYVVDTFHLSSFNLGFVKFAVIFVDVFSRLCFAKAYRKLNADNTTDALEELIKINDGIIPKIILSDQGTEFYGKFKAKCEQYKIKLARTSTNQINKTSIVERKIKTLRKLMGRILSSGKTNDIKDALELAVKITNNSYNRTIGRSPASVNDQNRASVMDFQRTIWMKNSSFRPKNYDDTILEVGSQVRVRRQKEVFTKSNIPSVYPQLYEILKVFRTDNNSFYKVRNPEEENSILDYRFSRDELVKAEKDALIYKKIERAKKKYVDTPTGDIFVITQFKDGSEKILPLDYFEKLKKPNYLKRADIIDGI